MCTTHQLRSFHCYNGDAKRLCSTAIYCHCLCAYFGNPAVHPPADDSHTVYSNNVKISIKQRHTYFL